MTQSYEHLEGGRGRAVYFRARRYKPYALLGAERASLRVGDLEAELSDLSITGMACNVGPPATTPTPGSVVKIAMSVRDRPAFSATATVVWARPSGLGRTRVGLRFLDALVDPDTLRALRSAVAFREALDSGLSAYSLVPDSYKQIIADCVAFLAHWRKLLSQHDHMHNPASDELEREAEGRMRAEWQSIRARANQVIASFAASDAALLATKRYTELIVTPLLMDSPIWNRAYAKPRGYPGDFELMNLMYESERRGDSLFARIMNQLGREERLAGTVPVRKELLVRHIGEVVQRPADGRPTKIASIGAGPAREVEEFLVRHAAGQAISFTLIDQDEDALAFANERIAKAALPWAANVRVQCRYVSFRDLLSDPELLAELKSHDLIYSAGLFDYLPDRIAIPTIHQLFSLLCDGGRLVIGNAAEAPDVKWVPEFILDWHMIYRTHDQMHGLAAALDPPRKIEVERDASNTWHFLVVKRD
jgi:extracellular factor (EF) 3-hydroxypalmitic acid methyl ester biosynthesis protein